MTGETQAERQEAAATRRRWVTLAEVLAVAGVLIAALTLWNNISERRSADADRTAERLDAAKAAARLDLSATIKDGGRTLLLKDERHELQDVEIAFPKALGVATQRPVADPAIDAGWVEPAILKLTDGGSDEQAGRLPALVTVHYVAGDAQRSSTAIYNLIWRTHGRILRGRELQFEGMRLRSRGGSQAALDAAWAQEKPTR